MEQILLDLFHQGHFVECEQTAREAIEQNPNHGFAWKVLGVLLKQQERYIQALEAMQSAVELLPNDAEAHSNLGVMLMNQGLLHDAVDSYSTALALNPLLFEVQHLLGLTFNTLGKTSEAEQCYLRVLQLNPEYVDALYHLGRIYQQQGRLADAEQCFRRVLQHHSDISDVHSQLAWVLHWQGKLEEAEHYYRSAIRIDANNAQAQGQLALLLQMQGRFLESKQAYETALRLQPEFAELHNNLGIVYHELGLAEQAQTAYQNAIRIKNDFFEVYNNLGLSFQRQGRFSDAELAYRQALQINPKHSETYNNLGIVFQTSEKFIEAKACYQRALMIQPENAHVQYNLATLYQEQGQLTQAEHYFNQALTINPNYSDARSRLLWLMKHRGASPEDCLQQALLYGKSVAVQTYSRWQCDTQPDRLRIGMVIGDLNYRGVGRFLTALFPELDDSCLELYIYSIAEQDAELIAQLQPYCASWQSLSSLNNQQAAQLIHQQGIHILFDLVGHAPKNRLALFAWQAAPVQVSWLGTLMTTGLTTMTYLLGDGDVTPSEHSKYFSETLWRMPDCYRCFVEPPVYLETDEELPALNQVQFTFACFQPLYCLNQDTLKLWAMVLHAVPNSQLYLKNAQLNDIHACQNLREQFADLGILPERLILEGSSSLVERLSAYRHIDIALDTFPETGFGSVEALWMAVPVLTLEGNSFISRCGASIAHNAGLAEWIAIDEEDYVAKAVYFSGNLDYLTILRNQLRDRLLESPLFDVTEFARNFEAMLWSMYNP